MIRKLSTSSYLMARRLTRRSNPGLGYQICSIEDAVEVIQSDPEGFGDLESDLFNAHNSLNKHELDLKRQSEITRLRIVKRKYFREEPLPNLLTYAEKEHIRFLHSSDEEEWTIEKLAESFPANPEIICKILKARWIPLSPKRIYSHDENVLKNWERFKNGEYKANMSKELHDHLLKFIDRKANNLKISNDPTHAFQKKQWQKPISNEFSLIISSLQSKVTDDKKPRALQDKQKNREVGVDSADMETHILGEIKKKKPITFHQLKVNCLLKTTKDSKDSGTKISENMFKAALVSDQNSDTSNVIATNYSDKFMVKEISISELDRKRYEMTSTKRRIYIPRKLWRKGATYQADDCYYDDDGEFLYKVPGMSFR